MVGSARSFRVALLAAMLAGLPAAVAAEVLVFTGGGAQETQGPWAEKGRSIVFTAPGGTLQMVRAEEVDLAASRFLSAQRRGDVQPAASTTSAPPPPDPADLQAPSPSCAFAWRVTTVQDGDTFEVEAGPSHQTVRVACLDAPERAHPDRAVARLGAASAAHARSVLAGNLVCLVDDPDQPDRDRLDRLVAHVTLPGGVDYAAAAIALGYGTAWRSGRCGRQDLYARLEALALAAQRGLWGPTDGAGSDAPRDPTAPVYAGIAGDGVAAAEPTEADADAAPAAPAQPVYVTPMLWQVHVGRGEAQPQPSPAPERRPPGR